MPQVTRREILIGCTSAVVTAVLPVPTFATITGPRAILFFDDDGLASTARVLLGESGYSVTEIDLRLHDASVADGPWPAGYVLASADRGRVRQLVEALAAGRCTRLILFGAPSMLVNCRWGCAVLREAPPIVRKWVRTPRPTKRCRVVGSPPRLS